MARAKTRDQTRGEDVDRQPVFSLERVQHHDLLLVHINNHHGVDGIKPINRMQVNEHDGAVPIRHHSPQFRKREGVFHCFDKPPCSAVSAASRICAHEALNGSSSPSTPLLKTHTHDAEEAASHGCVSRPLVDSRPSYTYKWHKSTPRQPWSLVLTFPLRSE